VVILKRLMQDLLASSCHTIQGSVKRAGTHDIQSERLEEEKKTSNSKRGARLRCHHVTAFAFHAMHGWRRHVAYEIKTSTVQYVP
jgi:hypothetical protein